MKAVVIQITLCLFLVSCASAELTEQAQLVDAKPISPLEDGKKCKFLTQAMESRWMALDDEEVKIDLRNHAADVGANYVHFLGSEVQGERRYGKANLYRCPKDLAVQ